MDRKDILHLLEISAPEDIEKLLRDADRVRREQVGNEVYLRAIIEFSNCCECNCLYCGLRQENEKLQRYTMAPDAIIESAKTAKAMNIGTVVLQSGESRSLSITQLCRVIAQIKEMDLAITISLGELDFADYKSLRTAGADRYLLKFETSDKKLYEYLRPGQKLKTRLACLEELKRLGFQTGSGNMIGLPQQTKEIIADDIVLFNTLDLDMVSVSPFIPNPDTPLSGSNIISLDEVARVTAITRIYTKNTHIPATTASGSLDEKGREKMLRAGANVVMPNITPIIHKPHYAIYPDKICINEGMSACMPCLTKRIESIGRTPGLGRGDSFKQHHLR